MHKLLAVIRREFLTRVRTRTFVIGTFLGPVLIGGLMLLPAYFAGRQAGNRVLVILDEGSNGFADRVAQTLLLMGEGQFETSVVAAEGRDSVVLDSLIAITDPKAERVAGIDGILVIPANATTRDSIRYLGDNVSSLSEMRSIRNAVTQVIRAERLAQAGVDARVVAEANRPISFTTEKVTNGTLTGESGEASFALAYSMSFILYLALLLYGVQIVSAVIEEKSTRINEVLISSLKPFQLLLGKILGVGSAGLLQLGIWTGTAMVLTTYRTEVAGLLGIPAQTVVGLQLPTVSPALMIVLLLFFFLGFFLYASAYGAVGAMCNSVQESQQAAMPITMLIVVSFISVFSLLNDPNGTLARVMSLIPFSAPLVVPVRYSLSPLPPLELLAAIVCTILGVLAVAWVAGRIYRVGILMHGKKAKLGEVIRWVREG